MTGDKMSMVLQPIDTQKLTTSFMVSYVIELILERHLSILNPLSFFDDNVNIVIFQRCLQSSILEQDKRSVFSIIQAEFDKAKGDVDSKRIFLDQSFRDCVTSDSKLDMDKYSDLVQLSIKGKIAFDLS